MPLNARSTNQNDIIAAAQRFLVSKLPGDSDSDWKASGARVATSDMYTHVYFTRLLVRSFLLYDDTQANNSRQFDIPVINAVAHVVIKNSDKNIIAYSGIWSPKFNSMAQMFPAPDDNTAYAAAEKSFGPGFTRVPGSFQPMAWYMTSQDHADLVVSVQVSKPNGDSWRTALVQIHSKQVIVSVEMNKHASYTVAPIHETDVSAGLVKIDNPSDPVASPDGWHKTNGGKDTAATE